MNIDKKTKLGSINISEEAIRNVASLSTLECYGVIGLATKSNVMKAMIKVLKKPERPKAIVVHQRKAGYELDIFVVLSQGIKIPEIVGEIQKKVKYDLEKKFLVPFSAIHVYVQAIKTK